MRNFRLVAKVFAVFKKAQDLANKAKKVKASVNRSKKLSTLQKMFDVYDASQREKGELEME